MSREVAVEVLARRGVNRLCLDGLAAISPEVARVVATSGCESISLDCLTEITRPAADALARFQGEHLSLDGLTGITPDVADALARFQGACLSLDGLTEITPGVAEPLARFPREFLWLSGVATITPEAATALAEFRGKNLNLSGLVEITPEVAKALATLPVGTLYLDGLTEISTNVAKALGHFRGDRISLAGLKKAKEASRGVRLPAVPCYPPPDGVVASQPAACRQAVGLRGDDTAFLAEYKAILASILPTCMLTREGLLKTPDGGGEQIRIFSSGPRTLLQRLGLAKTPTQGGEAFYDGGLPLKTIRHYLRKAWPEIHRDTYALINSFITTKLSFFGLGDLISVINARHRGVLAHETCHDIQGYLYDHYPDVSDRLDCAVSERESKVLAWLNSPGAFRYRGNGNYTAQHLFPKISTDSPYFGVDDEIITAVVAMNRNIESRTGRLFTLPISPAVFEALAEATKACGRNEVLPVLLSASSEGNKVAQQIAAEVFHAAGLKTDFYKTLPFKGYYRRR